MITAFINGRVLLDSGFASDKAVIVQGTLIVGVVSPDAVPSAAQRVDLQGSLLLPGFVDVQVNGGGGVLFNDAHDIDAVRTLANAHRAFGTTGLLPTLISDDLSVIASALALIEKAIEANVAGVLGIHVEGPFLSAERRGVHDASKFRELDEPAFKLLTSLKRGKLLLTLAPETTTPEMIRRLARAGIVISAGHTNARYSQIRGAIDAGLRGFTHLFNAMSPLTGREPGTVGAALEDLHSWCGLIVDGHHVDSVTMKLALRCKPIDRFMLVTDAMPTVGMSGESFMLQGRRITVRNGICLDEAGTLAGSNLNMAAAVKNAVRMLEVDLATAVRMASAHPAAFLGLDRELGRIAPGYRANFVMADDQMNVQETWIDGVSRDASEFFGRKIM
jgi:N-acetylglucosamine-6-phosphate deacetylase